MQATKEIKCSPMSSLLGTIRGSIKDSLSIDAENGDGGYELALG